MIDPQFNTTDVAVVVKTDLVTAKYSHYERKLHGPVPGDTGDLPRGLLAVLLTALALVPAGRASAGAAEQAGLPEEAYFAARAPMPAGGSAGVLPIGALLANAALAVPAVAAAGGAAAGAGRGGAARGRARGVLRLDLAGQPGHRQLDPPAGGLGSPARHLGMVAMPAMPG